jgi:hypothetical protein
MAADSPRYATLTGGAVSTVTFDQDYEQVELLNIDGAAEVSVRVGTTGVADPVAGETGVELLPAAIAPLTLDVHTSGPTVVKLLAATAARVVVRGLNQ